MSRGVKKGSIRGPYRRKSRPKKYVCSCSFGKDSLATLLLAIEKGEPLDAVVYTELWNELRELDKIEGLSSDRFKYAESLGDIDKKVDEYEQKYFAYL